MSIIIDCLFRNISPKLSSHWAAWPYLRRMQWMKSYGDFSIEVNHEPLPDYGRAETLWLYHGMEWKPDCKVLGLTGGLSHAVVQKFERFLEFEGRVESMDVPMPDFGALIRARSDWPQFTTSDFLDKLSKRCLEIRESYDVLRDPMKPCLVLGDSHALSMAGPTSMCSRNDFKTLHGALEIGIPYMVKDFLKQSEDFVSPTTLVTYFGNIDVRHHICRLSGLWTDQKKMIDEMVESYVCQLNVTRDELSRLKKVTMVAPLPIEDESRVLPQTGYFKGKPFWGKWNERTSVVNYMTEKMQQFAEPCDIQVYKHPETYYNSEGQLRFEVMEKPRSVHLSREFYPFDFETGNVNGKLHWKDEKMSSLLRAKL